MSLYIMSDIHGNLRAFDSVMNQIAMGDDDHLIVLGDVIDRHPNGLYIMQKLMAMKNKKVLLGNHEYMMLRALGINWRGSDITYGEDEKSRMDHWYQNGGNVTHYEWEYCLTADQRADVGDFISNLRPERTIEYRSKGLGKFLLCHAAPIETYDPNERHHFNNLEWCVWDRTSLEHPVDLGMPVIFGHTPTQHIDWTKGPSIMKLEHNWIAIDCGAGSRASSGGRLACLRIDNMQEFYSE